MRYSACCERVARRMWRDLSRGCSPPPPPPTRLTSIMLARLPLYLLATFVAGTFAAWETVDEAGAPLATDYGRLLVLKLSLQPP